MSRFLPAWLRPVIGAAVAGLVAFMLYRGAYASRSSNVGDNFWYVPAASSLLHEGNLELSEFERAMTPRQRPHCAGIALRDDIQVRVVDGRVYNYFPAMVSVLIAPAVALLEPYYAGIQNPLDRSQVLAGVIALLLAVASVSLMYPLALRLLESPGAAATATVLLGLCTPHFSAHAGGLWSHNVGMFLLVLMLLAAQLRGIPGLALAGACAGLGCTCRPDFLPFAAALGLHLLVRHRVRIWPFVAAGALVGAGWMTLSHAMYGTWMPPYFGAGRAHSTSVLQALSGLLVSPNRGLLIFCPWVLAAWFAAVRSWRPSAFDAQSVWPYLALALAGHVALVSMFPHWWGGFSFGPRFFALASPVLALLAVRALVDLHRHGTVARGFVLALFVAAATWSAVVQYRGAVDTAGLKWNATPANVDRAPWRVWDWNDLQALRGW